MPVDSVKKVDVATVAELLDREISQGEIELPLLPAVATKVLSSSVDERADATLLADLIRQDQGLATHVLRVVNSPGLRGTIQQAITRLGMERIREIAVSASVKKPCSRKVPICTSPKRLGKLHLRLACGRRKLPERVVKM